MHSLHVSCFDGVYSSTDMPFMSISPQRYNSESNGNGNRRCIFISSYHRLNTGTYCRYFKRLSDPLPIDTSSHSTSRSTSCSTSPTSLSSGDGAPSTALTIRLPARTSAGSSENFITFRGAKAGLEGEFIRPQGRDPTAHEIGRAVNTGIRSAGSVIDSGVDSSPGMHDVDRTELSQQRSGSCCRWPVGNMMGG